MILVICRPSAPSSSCGAEGIDGLLVCSASHEEDALTEMSDLILDGPPGVAEWLTRLAQSLSRLGQERSA